jgi:hypothetical protein
MEDALLVPVELHEDQVPQLDEAVAAGLDELLGVARLDVGAQVQVEL